MAYFDDFVTYNTSPYESWTRHTQAFLDEEFINSSNITTIGEEVEFGSLIFEDIPARVTSCLDSKVGDKHNDDFKTVFFPNIDYKPKLGSRFQFDNNVWIVYNTENINSLNSSCYVRRCSNTINSLDYYGNVHREPCVLDIKPTKSSFIEDESLWTVSTRQIIFFQKNQWTEDIAFNSRIMFESQTYRVGVNLNFDRTETFDDSSITLVRAYLDLDLVNDFDNKEYQIADFSMPKFEINIPQSAERGIGYSGVLPVSVYRNDSLVVEDVVYSSTNDNVVSIDENGIYTCNGEGTATVRVALKENPLYYSETVYTVNSSPRDVYETKITPDDLHIPLNGSVTYSAIEYMNGVPIGTEFEFSVMDIPSKYYSIEINGNSCTITNKMESSSVLLKLVIKNNRSLEETEYYIELGGLF